ncbi:Abhydrolase family protein [Stieleria maiorica]|uniref:Abhydrolase family protein n=1 Tax=Stieleria maiorica TaxID=2795974 RepID=A0A5B9M8D5_9BACT|nr:alpha/beta hydrolase family protein [Stieleria maiorica]QEF96909.1 Abhydrolase family protein [Stieleria maiorica]
MTRLLAGSLAFLIVAISGATSSAQTEKLKTLNDHFPFSVPQSVQAWDERSESLRRRVLVATGLWPMPDKTPLSPVLHGNVHRDGFTVEKVYFQSLPGHYVTGMLFRPAADNSLGLVDGKRPAVLSPHGHGGRTMRLSDAELAKQLESGGEIFENSGRYPKLARCAHLARMGCVTLIFDMLGYADSQQIDYQTAHRHANPRPEEADRQAPCLFGIDADLNLQSVMGLQTWNAIRALDFLAELPDVDPERLGVTGGSGGGTQTILLGAIDPRIKVGFPNGMVSTSMQGGCYCENCNYLRIGTGNVELAALFAPKPQGMTAANDWTKAMLDDGYPELQELYAMLGAPENVMCGDVLRFPHNYNYVTRSMMYPWMAKHLGLPDDVPLVETDFQPLTEADMKVWNDEHPAPTDVGIPHERKVLAWWKDQSDRKLDALIPDRSAEGEAANQQLAEYRRVVGGAWNVIFDRSLPAAQALHVTELDSGTDSEVTRYRIEHRDWKTVVDFDVISGSSPNANGHVVAPVTFARNAAQQDASQRDAIAKSVAAKGTAGATVVVYLAPSIGRVKDSMESEHQQPLIADDRSYSGLTFGYNRPLAVKRFEQLLCVLAHLHHAEPEGALSIVADESSCISSAAAAVVAGDAVDRLDLESRGFRISRVSDYSDQHFVPGAAKYFDLPGLLSLRAPAALKIRGETDHAMELVKKVYAASGAGDRLMLE